MHFGAVKARHVSARAGYQGDLSGRALAWLGRDGGRLRRLTHPVAATLCAESAACAAGGSARLFGPLSSRSRDLGDPPSPTHRRRGGLGLHLRWPAVSGHGVSGGRDAGLDAPPRGAACRNARPAASTSVGRGSAGSAQRRGRPPRPEAQQHLSGAARGAGAVCQDPRLWHRQADPRCQHSADRAGLGDGHARLYGSRASAGTSRPGGPTRRPVLTGGHLVRDADRQARILPSRRSHVRDHGARGSRRA